MFFKCKFFEMSQTILHFACFMVKDFHRARAINHQKSWLSVILQCSPQRKARPEAVECNISRSVQRLQRLHSTTFFSLMWETQAEKGAAKDAMLWLQQDRQNRVCLNGTPPMRRTLACDTTWHTSNECHRVLIARHTVHVATKENEGTPTPFWVKVGGS